MPSLLNRTTGYEYINEPTLADAIMDRLTAQVHRIELKGESRRKKKNIQENMPS